MKIKKKSISRRLMRKEKLMHFETEHIFVKTLLHAATYLLCHTFVACDRSQV